VKKSDLKKRLYHIDLNREMIRGARLAFLPGDPFRVDKIARAIGGDFREIAWNREYRSILARMDNQNILITSTGIGGPSTAIAIEELARLGIQTLIRVGTTGAIQPYIKAGNVVITTGSVRLDGTSTHYAPIEYPAVAHPEVLFALISAAQKLKTPHHIGITASTDTFYTSQERPDTFSGYVIRRLRGATQEWRRLNVLNYEMESSTLLVLSSAFGLRTGCVTGVVAVRPRGEKITPEHLRTGEKNAIAVAVEATRNLIKD
jgi:uridine phosphorylase